MKRKPHPLAGKVVILKCEPDPDNLNGKEFTIQDWWINVSGISWGIAKGNPACIKYSIRSALAGIPSDDEVVYGKIQDGEFRFGHLVHVTELGEEVVSKL